MKYLNITIRRLHILIIWILSIGILLILSKGNVHAENIQTMEKFCRGVQFIGHLFCYIIHKLKARPVAINRITIGRICRKYCIYKISCMVWRCSYGT